MCGRYAQTRSGYDLATDLRASLGAGVAITESYNTAPTMESPILVNIPRKTRAEREIHVALWGLIPRWAKDTSFSNKTFNARVETVLEKPSFRGPVRSQRCAVPASAYYEWQKNETSSRPYAVTPKDSGAILFAGIYEWWKGPDQGVDAPWVLSYSILTGPSPDTTTKLGFSASDQETSSLQDLARLHHRMPLALDEDLLEKWLNPEITQTPDVNTLLEELRDTAWRTASTWRIYPVDRAVGNIRNNSPGLLNELDS